MRSDQLHLEREGRGVGKREDEAINEDLEENENSCE